MKIITVVDAGQGEPADQPLKTRDHQCICILLVSTAQKGQESITPGQEVRAGVLSWQSSGVQRVSHASFDFEAIVAVSSLDLTVNIREIIGEVQLGNCPPRRDAKGTDESRRIWRQSLLSAELHSDSMGLVKAVRLGLTASLQSRRRRDILDLRESLAKGDVDVLMHIDGPTNFADVGTKPLQRTTKAMPIAIRLIQKGYYFPRKSRDHAATFDVAAVTNHAVYLIGEYRRDIENSRIYKNSFRNSKTL